MAFADFHIHTVFSDGVNTVRDCVEVAHQKGLLALGISDHSFTPFDTSYCMRPETGLAQYEATLLEEQQRAFELYGLPLLPGLELDYGSENPFESVCYTIGSVHYIMYKGEIYAVDNSPEEQLSCLQNLFSGNTLEYSKVYFEQVVRHAEKNKPTVIGHFDLLTKYGFIDDTDPAYLAVAREALSEVVRHVPLFEINQGAVIRGLKTKPYPAAPLLSDLCALGGKILLSSDAHSADKLTFGFTEMLHLAQRAGFTRISRLTPDGIVEDEIKALMAE